MIDKESITIYQHGKVFLHTTINDQEVAIEIELEDMEDQQWVELILTVKSCENK